MSLLELFEGKIDLDTLKKLSLPEIYKLRDAKLKFIKEKQEIQKKMEEEHKKALKEKKSKKK